MPYTHTPPIHLVMATLGLILAIAAAWRGLRQLAAGLRQATRPAGALGVARGLRGVVAAVGLAALSAGLLLSSRGLLAFGVIFLAEELYETGVVILALRLAASAEEAT
jgi:hypothetical protein